MERKTTQEQATPRRFRSIIESRFSSVEDLAAFDGERVRARRLLQSFPELVVLEGACDHTLNLSLGGTFAVERYDGSRLNHRISRPHTVTVLPAGHSNGWRAPGLVDVLQIYIDDDVIRQLAEVEFDLDPARIRILDLIEVEDVFVRALAPVILHEMESKLHRSRILLDSFDVMLAGHLLRGYSNVGRRFFRNARTSSGQHEDQKVAQARGYLEERLDEDIRLNEVANHVGLSTFRLSRLFKANVGVTPYQYLLQRRIARAQELLAKGDMPLAGIAYACGFASQSHMTDIFREKLAITPGRYRKEVRS